MAQRILLASGNAKKLAELRALCAELPVEILSPADLPHGLPDVVEDGDTFLANARKKALAAARIATDQLGGDVWALADDSGLCVDALDGAPGVYSARYALLGAAEGDVDGGNAPDGSNNEKLLHELQGLPAEQRGAAFHCVIVVARAAAGRDDAAAGHDGVEGSATTEELFNVDGSVRGRILEAADGEQGFGYDPLFWHEQSACSFARLSGEQKAQVSHRGEAVRQLRELLQVYFGKEND
ncbi:MAG: non-canonical purine NTP pyrophosphatase [Planctomycetes bacterium]|nr:non-canonical purine NTP pyrophosphatase [Planctomycetota bacterium]